MQKLSYILLLLALISWGTAFSVIKYCLVWLTPGQLVLLRFLIAGIITSIVWVFHGRRRLPSGDLVRMAVIGLLSVPGYQYCLSLGQTTVPAGIASVIVNIMPVISSVLAVFYLGEVITIRRFVGLVLGFGGVLVINQGQGAGWKPSTGIIYLLLGACAWAISTLLQKELYRRYSPFEVMTYTITLGSLMLLPGIGELEGLVRPLPASVIASLLFLGIINTVVAYAFWSRALAVLEVSRAVSFIYLVPVVGVGVAWLFHGEKLTHMDFAGASLILGALWIVQRPGSKRISSMSKQLVRSLFPLVGTRKPITEKI